MIGHVARPVPSPLWRSIAALRAIVQLMPRFVGKRAGTWLSIGFVASWILSAAEYGTTIFLQKFLKILGLLGGDAVLPGPFGDWNPSHAHLAALLLLIGTARSIGQFFVCQSGVMTSETINGRLRLVVLHRMLIGRPQEYMGSATTNLHIGENFPKAAKFCESVVYLLSNAVLGGGIAIMMMLYAWREALFGLIGLGLVGVLVLRCNRSLAATARRIPLAQQELLVGIDRIARNWLLVRILRTGRREYDRLVGSTLLYTASSYRAGAYTFFGSVLPPFLGVILLVGILALHFSVWNGDGLAFLSFLYLFIRFSQYVGNSATYFGQAVSTFPQFRASAEFMFLDQAPVIAAAVEPLATIGMRTAIGTSGHLDQLARSGEGVGVTVEEICADRLKKIEGPAIDIKGVEFTYGKGQRPVFLDLHLTIRSGEQFAVVGRSGVGKSTLLSLILGVLEPSKGSIEIDGVSPLQYFARKHLRLGYVGPEAFLLDGPLMVSLTYGLGFAVTDEECWAALEQASLGEAIRAMPGGLSYRISDNGSGLSAGQKQRLSLARALLARPDLLVLDEASANLDDDSESAIAQSICSLKGRTTVIIVSHRPGIIKYADQVLRLS